LTNLYVKWNPLRDEDSAHGNQYKRRLLEIGIGKAGKRKAAQQKYRAKRATRISAHFGADMQGTDLGAGAMLDKLY